MKEFNILNSNFQFIPRNSFTDNMAESFMTMVTTNAFLQTTPIPILPDDSFNGLFTTIATLENEETTGVADVLEDIFNESTPGTFQEWTSPLPNEFTTGVPESLLETLAFTDDEGIEDSTTDIFDSMTTASNAFGGPDEDAFEGLPETTRAVLVTEKMLTTENVVETVTEMLTETDGTSRNRQSK